MINYFFHYNLCPVSSEEKEKGTLAIFVSPIIADPFAFSNKSWVVIFEAWLQ